MLQTELSKINYHRRKFHLPKYQTVAECLANDGPAKLAAYNKIQQELEELDKYNDKRAKQGRRIVFSINEMKKAKRADKRAERMAAIKRSAT